MPPEHAPHEETLMCWPVNRDLYGDSFSDAEHAHADIANTIARYEPVRMFASHSHSDRARSLCGNNVEVHEVVIDDSWCRDTGPVYVYDSTDHRIAIDWRFNGWGQRFTPFNNDDALAGHIAKVRGDQLLRMDMVFEGGSLQVDGRGTGATTMQCLLHPNRNPGMSQKEIEHTLDEVLGVSKLVWLPFGLSLDSDTDGHVDNVAAFTASGHFLLQGSNAGDEEDHMRTSVNEKVARSSVDAVGRELQVEVLPVLPYVDTVRGRKCAPYVNYYVANDCVVVPVTGHEADEDMLQIIESMYPGRDVVGLPVAHVLATGGGGIHCLTQQVPAKLHTGASH